MRIIIQSSYLFLFVALVSFMGPKVWAQSDEAMSADEIADMVDDFKPEADAQESSSQTTASTGGMTDPGFTAPAGPVEYESTPVSETPEKIDDENEVDQELGSAGGAGDALHESAYGGSRALKADPTPIPEARPEPWMSKPTKKKIKKVQKAKKSKKWAKKDKKAKKHKWAKAKKKKKDAYKAAKKKSGRNSKVADRKPSSRRYR